MSGICKTSKLSEPQRHALRLAVAGPVSCGKGADVALLTAWSLEERGMVRLSDAGTRPRMRLTPFGRQYATTRERTGGYHSCICPTPKLRAGKQHGDPDAYEWKIDPKCPYHTQAALHPFDHSIPWNCPTYWDGCNCRETVAKLRGEVGK